MFRRIGISGINTYTKDQFFEHGRTVEPLNSLLRPDHKVITTDINGGVDLWVRMSRHRKGEKFSRLTHMFHSANEDLVDLSDVVFFFWDGKHGGIRKTIQLCQSIGKPYWVTGVESNAGLPGMRKFEEHWYV